MFAILIRCYETPGCLVVQRAAMCNPAACLLPKLLGFTETLGAFFPAILTASYLWTRAWWWHSSFPGKLLGMRVSRSSPTTSMWCLLLTSLLQPELLVSETRQPGREFEWVLKKSSQQERKDMVKIIFIITTCCTGEEPRGGCSFGRALLSSQMVIQESSPFPYFLSPCLSIFFVLFSSKGSFPQYGQYMPSATDPIIKFCVCKPVLVSILCATLDLLLSCKNNK